ncbi:MAG TPA: hypothetical protein PK299_14535 [Anaerolineales bacterium]|nr:hypothetical protein [Anaerolineales bacterium]
MALYIAGNIAPERCSAFVRPNRQVALLCFHAPRQVGKTTMMLELARELTESGAYLAVLVCSTRMKTALFSLRKKAQS